MAKSKGGGGGGVGRRGRASGPRNVNARSAYSAGQRLKEIEKRLDAIGRRPRGGLDSSRTITRRERLLYLRDRYITIAGQ